MGRRLYRATKSVNLSETLLQKTEHVVTKHEDGSFYCEVHRCTADECAPRQQSEIVWSSGLDRNTYVVAVVRTEPYRGLLSVTRGVQCIFKKAVGISYDAPFGPDGEDVLEWQEIGIQAADADYRRRGERPPK